MADKEVKIRIDTDADVSGAKQTEQALEHVSTSATRANTNAANLAKSTNTSADGFKGMGRDVQNVSFQLQDFAVQVDGGTSVMRAFTQQAPQLLSFLGPYGAIAGAAIAVAPLLYKLFKTGEVGAESAEQAAKRYAATLEVFEEIAKRQGEEARGVISLQKQSDEERIQRLQTQQALEERIFNAETNREKARIKADGNLEVARERLKLATIEKQLATSTGENALKLAKEREETLKRILEKEREIAEQIRQQDEKAAQQKVDGAQEAVDETSGSRSRASEALAREIKVREDLQGILAQEARKRLELLIKLDQEIEQAVEDNKNPFDIEASGRLDALLKQREELLRPNEREGEATAKLTEQKKAEADARERSEEAAKQLEEAEKKLVTATSDLEQLRRDQAQERATEKSQADFDAQHDFTTGKQQIADDLATKIGDFLKSLNLPSPEQNSGVKFFLDQVSSLAEGGIDETERQAAEAAVQKLIGLSNADVGAKTALFQQLSTAFESANKADAKLAGILEKQNRINDEHARRLGVIEENMRHLPP